MPLKKCPKKRLPSSDGPNPRSRKIPRQDQDGAGPKDLSLSACPTPATSLKMPSVNKTAPASPAKGGAALMKFKLPTGGASEKPGALDLTDGETDHFTTSGKKMNRNVNKTTAVVLPWPLAKHASRIAQMRMRSKPIAKMHNDY